MRISSSQIELRSNTSSLLNPFHLPSKLPRWPADGAASIRLSRITHARSRRVVDQLVNNPSSRSCLAIDWQAGTIQEAEEEEEEESVNSATVRHYPANWNGATSGPRTLARSSIESIKESGRHSIAPVAVQQQSSERVEITLAA